MLVDHRYFVSLCWSNFFKFWPKHLIMALSLEQRQYNHHCGYQIPTQVLKATVLAKVWCAYTNTESTIRILENGRFQDHFVDISRSASVRPPPVSRVNPTLDFKVYQLPRLAISKQIIPTYLFSFEKKVPYHMAQFSTSKIKMHVKFNLGYGFI